MIRPIDTQILYPQSQELSNRQQVDNQKTNVQQHAFAQVMKNEVEEKKKIVIQAQKKEKIAKDKERAPNDKGQQRKKQNHKQKHIDVRI